MQIHALLYDRQQSGGSYPTSLSQTSTWPELHSRVGMLERSEGERGGPNDLFMLLQHPTTACVCYMVHVGSLGRDARDGTHV